MSTNRGRHPGQAGCRAKALTKVEVRSVHFAECAPPAFARTSNGSGFGRAAPVLRKFGGNSGLGLCSISHSHHCRLAKQGSPKQGSSSSFSYPMYELAQMHAGEKLGHLPLAFRRLDKMLAFPMF
jgi:hypothetical protein